MLYTKFMKPQWGHRQKVRIIVTIILVPAIIVGFFVTSHLLQKPTCFDGAINGEEDGVDCGGSCRLICLADSRPLLPWWTQAFEITENVYSFVAYYSNLNASAGIQKIGYEILFYDANQKLIGDAIYAEASVPPQETGVFFVSGVTVPAGEEVTSAFIRFVEDPVWIRFDPRHSVRQLSMTNIRLETKRLQPRVTARVVNTTFEEFFDVTFVAIVYDAYDNPVHASETYVDYLAPEDERDIYFTWPHEFDRQAVRVEIVPHIDFFDERNSL